MTDFFIAEPLRTRVPSMPSTAASPPSGQMRERRRIPPDGSDHHRDGDHGDEGVEGSTVTVAGQFASAIAAAAAAAAVCPGAAAVVSAAVGVVAAGAVVVGIVVAGRIPPRQPPDLRTTIHMLDATINS